MLIGNAAGVELEFNGEPVEVKGESGQVRMLKFPPSWRPKAAKEEITPTKAFQSGDNNTQ